ncbi:2-dehydro-3-deoxygalactonokinase [Pacificibacter maritimus]|uniref:2-dehydro-3-deoxygalactonokinase n=1 Tax=Pacificibacter maritimus TaxID=762213 RepID=A0A3N4V0L3_9RHOB|nr:2-dehydro-3-deoxygalactonokinase [Pacificibacter maritimus]RPE66454.1 2-dehydro-3-deoxygalactonokinase [Pacificibacter maritimus]
MKVDWIAVSCSDTSLQAWVFGSSGEILDELTESISSPAKATDIIDRVSPWLDKATTPHRVSIIACGNIDHIPNYTCVPCAPLSAPILDGGIKDDRATLQIISGISQASPADVLLGAQVQIAGFQAKFPKFDGVLLLPGPHSVWAHVSADEIVSFQSFMTGELMAIISQSSSLKSCLGDGFWDDRIFDDALSEALSRPERLAAKLLSLRADHLLGQAKGGSAKARLAGLLVGAELAAAKPYWLGQMVGVIGADALTEIYINALKSQGIAAQHADPTEMTKAGLALARVQQLS